ncbi:site-specific integrase [Dactylosporangium sp. NPDC051541]|uniref:site-specific integrase n=1 Tax=Dactylosporangium sp. NPDC051541 TaxID=3363977 RepID=UPI0037AE2F29
MLDALKVSEGTMMLDVASGPGYLASEAIPSAIFPAMLAHLKEFVSDGDDALVFTVRNGRPIWRGNFNTLVQWSKAVTAIGKPGLHFHDLRHTGNHLAAKTGATLRDLMDRMGQDSPRAALIYQHGSREADRQIADAVSAAVEAERKKARKGKRRPLEGLPEAS